jgi:hypothetical protein
MTCDCGQAGGEVVLLASKSHSRTGDLYCRASQTFILQETTLQIGDAPTYRTAPEAERLERCGIAESAERAGTKDSRDAHSASLPALCGATPQGW